MSLAVITVSTVVGAAGLTTRSVTIHCTMLLFLCLTVAELGWFIVRHDMERLAKGMSSAIALSALMYGLGSFFLGTQEFKVDYTT